MRNICTHMYFLTLHISLPTGQNFYLSGFLSDMWSFLSSFFPLLEIEIYIVPHKSICLSYDMHTIYIVHWVYALPSLPFLWRITFSLIEHTSRSLNSFNKASVARFSHVIYITFHRSRHRAFCPWGNYINIFSVFFFNILN